MAPTSPQKPRKHPSRKKPKSTRPTRRPLASHSPSTTSIMLAHKITRPNCILGTYGMFNRFKHERFPPTKTRAVVAYDLDDLPSGPESVEEQGEMDRAIEGEISAGAGVECETRFGGEEKGVSGWQRGGGGESSGDVEDEEVSVGRVRGMKLMVCKCEEWMRFVSAEEEDGHGRVDGSEDSAEGSGEEIQEEAAQAGEEADERTVGRGSKERDIIEESTGEKEIVREPLGFGDREESPMSEEALRQVVEFSLMCF